MHGPAPGPPSKAQRSGFGWERRSGGTSERLSMGRREGCGARDAAGRIEGELKQKLLELRG